MFERPDLEEGVRTGMEAVVNRRCIAIKTMFGVKIELILVHNTSTSHDRYYPKSLPQELSGSVEYTPTEPVPNPSDPMKFDKRMLRVDIDKVKQPYQNDRWTDFR